MDEWPVALAFLVVLFVFLLALVTLAALGLGLRVFALWCLHDRHYDRAYKAMETWLSHRHPQPPQTPVASIDVLPDRSTEATGPHLVSVPDSPGTARQDGVATGLGTRRRGADTTARGGAH
jgi:hypothetical protein